jgi:predicted Ser/Thr protein kinase
MVGKRFGDFEIKEEIGKGGMGQVYKARQISLDRDVAIKILPSNLSEVEEFRERFDVEAKAVASLMHENILQMYSKGVTDDGIHYFAMELVDGEDLADKIKRGVTFSEAEAIEISIQVCRGLEAAWKKGIIHRDIKPSNIMVAKNGNVKIADFGLAKSLDATKKLTQTNMYMGTVAYTSPEQGEGKPLDHRTDIYSLGIVLYQLLTGSVPFKAETPSSVIFKHVYEAPPSPRTIKPGVSPQAEAVVLKAIAKRPEDRFQNAVEFRDALEEVKKAQPGKKGEAAKQAAVVVPQPSSSGTAASSERKAGSNVPFLIAVVLIILLLGGSALYAQKYGGYRALFSKVFPFALQEENKGETASQAGGQMGGPPPREAGAPKVETAPPSGGDSLPGREFANVPPPAAVGKERTIARDNVAPGAAPAETRTAPLEQSRPAGRSQVPAVLVVTSGESNISDIVESVIGRKLQERSFPISPGGDIQALSDRYGRHKIPLKAFDQRPLKADVLIYVTVSTMNAAPLEFYGRSMEQHASTISLKVIDAATKKVIASPRAKTVHYTTLNMQDNIEEATEELVSDLPRRLMTFWKG